MIKVKEEVEGQTAIAEYSQTEAALTPEEPPAIVIDLHQHSAEGIMAKLETYGFECEASPLALCVEWQALKTIIGELRQDSNLLSALRAAGVDNWDGYDFAVESLEVAV